MRSLARFATPQRAGALSIRNRPTSFNNSVHLAGGIDRCWMDESVFKTRRTPWRH